MSQIDPALRSLHGRLGAYRLHAQVQDPAAHTAPARKAFNDRFEREVDPDGALDPQERARRAEFARKAYFLSLALKSAASRRKANAGACKEVAGQSGIQALAITS